MKIYKPNKGKACIALLLMLGVFMLCGRRDQLMAADDAKKDIASQYAATLYGEDDGLVSAEINTIAQTDDGYIWAGAYSGLYLFDGVSFEQQRLSERINNVIYLFKDSAGRLWIGTNDSGVAVYEPDSGDIRFYDSQSGLSADSIRSICEDDKGWIYVSTTDKLCRIKDDQLEELCAEDSRLRCAYSLKSLGDGRVMGVTQYGVFFILKDGKELISAESEDPTAAYTAAAYGTDGSILVGSAASELYRFRLSSGDELLGDGSISVDGLSYVNHIEYSPAAGGFLVAGSHGLFFADGPEHVEDLSRDGFYLSVSDAMTDRQGNLWFASTKQGILKLSPSAFTDIFKRCGQEAAAVNAVLISGDLLYAGTDTGLIMLNIRSMGVVENELVKELSGVRLRHILKDTHGGMWFSTYAQVGLLYLSPEGELMSMNEQLPFMYGSRFRFCMELSDGSIMAVSTEGANFIKDGVLVNAIGSDDGIAVQLLCAAEREDGSILAGSDGGGVYIIEDGSIAGHIGGDEGLLSQVILKIVRTKGGYILVSSNGLYFYSDEGELRHLDNFPYNNDYDVYMSEDGLAFVSSSAGVYVLKEEELLKDESYSDILLNRNRGFETTLTANAFHDVSGDKLYLCCTDGVRSMDIRRFNEANEDYAIALSHVRQDDKELVLKDNIYQLPAGRGRVDIRVAALNYALSNPMLSVQLMGVDEAPQLMLQSELRDLSYINLPYGDYELSVAVMDELSGEVKRQQSFYLHKDAVFYERMYFKILMGLLAIFLVALAVWIVTRMANMAVIKRQYEQIREAKEEAEYANKAKSRFLANMSHEIRTPINAVLGMDEMILRESDDAQIRDYAGDIYSSANTLLALINDILDSSKIESGKMELVCAEYEPAELLRNLMNMISSRAAKKDLKMELKADEDIPAKLYGDDVRLRQIITNILTNAVKYTHEGGVVLRASCVREGDDALLHIEVEDTGIGIKEEDLPKLFEAYQRIEEGRNRNIEGTGLGMNITVQLLKLMDSELKVTSEYGKGSKFYFDVRQRIVDASPMGDVHVRSKALEESGVMILTAPEAHVLVVDDNDMNRKVFRSLLKQTKIQIDEAAGGAQALVLAEQNDYDCVFLDHMMPDMDGVETLHRMRMIAAYEYKPIYVLTANAVTGAKEQYLSEGFDGFISKPIIYDKLEQALKEALPEDKQKLTQAERGAAAKTEHAERPVIDGLDWAYAQLHLPEDELLTQTLSEFYTLLDMQADRLDSMREDLDAYRIQVHAMKSAAATVGIVPLAGMAKMLEQAARDKDAAMVERLHKDFISEWRSYKDKLKELFGGQEEDKPRADREMLSAMLLMLKDALDDFDVDAADDIMEKLRSYSYDKETEDKLDKLTALVAALDTEAAAELIEELEGNK